MGHHDAVRPRGGQGVFGRASGSAQAEEQRGQAHILRKMGNFGRVAATPRTDRVARGRRCSTFLTVAWDGCRSRARRGSMICDWPLPQPPGWTKYVNNPQTEAELEAICRCVGYGSPRRAARLERSRQRRKRDCDRTCVVAAPSKRTRTPCQPMHLTQYMRLSPLVHPTSASDGEAGARRW